MVLDVILASTRKAGAAAQALDKPGQQAGGQQNPKTCNHAVILQAGPRTRLRPNTIPQPCGETKAIRIGSNMLPTCRPSKQRPDSHPRAPIHPATCSATRAVNVPAATHGRTGAGTGGTPHAATRKEVCGPDLLAISLQKDKWAPTMSYPKHQYVPGERPVLAACAASAALASCLGSIQAAASPSGRVHIRYRGATCLMFCVLCLQQSCCLLEPWHRP